RRDALGGPAKMRYGLIKFEGAPPAAPRAAAETVAPAVDDTLDTSVAGLYEARKWINDIIEGRGENSTGRYAARELVEVRAELDKALGDAAPDFGTYLAKYREGSAPLDVFKESD